MNRFPFDSQGALVLDYGCYSYLIESIMEKQGRKTSEGVMNVDVISLGELLVEVMRKEVDQSLDRPADFVGPFPSGAPAIFIDAIARLGHSAGFVGVVGNDDFGKCILDRFHRDNIDSTHVAVTDDYNTAVAFVMYFSDGGRKFLFHIPHAAAGKLGPDHIEPEYFSSAKFLHLMGSSLSVNESSREACYKAMQLVKNGGGKITFDPNLRPELLGIDKIREIINDKPFIHMSVTSDHRACTPFPIRPLRPVDRTCRRG